MAIIFYSVGGEGMGHATRSEAVINYLLLKGHTVLIFSYDRAFNHLKEVFQGREGILGFVEIIGVNFVYEKNQFKLGKTILKESKKIHALLIENISIFLRNIHKYEPKLVITDFEPFSNHVAKLLKLPLICIDNINFLTKCCISKKLSYIPNNFFVEYILNFNGDFNFITTIFKAKLKDKYKENTKLVGPILRDYILNAKPKEKDFILVYQTSKSNEKLFDVLKQTNEKYVVYGFDKNHKDKNLIFKKKSEIGFVNDLASCKGVITNGGFTLISEAAYLKKPIYSIPVKHQIEQQVNGHYVKEMSYGFTSKEINLDHLTYFLKHLPLYKRRLVKVHFEEPFSLIGEKVDELVKNYDKHVTLVKRIKGNYTYFVNQIPKFTRRYLPVKKEVKKLKFCEKNFNLGRGKKMSYSTFTFGTNPKQNILFIHGLGGNKSVFIDLTANLKSITKKGLNILIVDLIGHGKSSNMKSLKKYSPSFQSKIIKKIADIEFGKKSKVTIVGHCFGSFVAIKLAFLLKPSRLFLIASNPFLDNSFRIKLMKNPVIQKSMKLLFKKSKIVDKDSNYDYSKFMNSSDYNLSRIFVDVKNTSLRGYIASLYWMLNSNIKQDFLRLLKKHVKIIMVHGKKDKVFPYNEIKDKVKDMDLRLVSLPNANHLPAFNSKEKLAKIIEKELKHTS